MKYTIYNADTGQILYTLSCADASTAELNLVDKVWIDGDYSAEQYYVANGVVVEKPQRPQGFYDFDYATKTWSMNLIETQNALRYQRDAALSELDRVGAVWYNSLTTEQQAELATYRQALLNVPQQPGFPTQVEWPPKPTWL